MPKVTAEHRAARRADILHAAMQCVAIDGYHKMTIADVIAESGLSAGAVYGYYKSKQDLIAAIALHVSGQAQSLVRECAQLDPMPPPAEILRVLTQSLVSRVEESPVDLSRVVVNTWAEAVRHEQIHQIVNREFTAVRGDFTEVLRRSQAAGHIDSDADLEAAARTMLGLLPGFILQRLVLGDVDPDTYAAGLTALSTPPRA